MASEIEKKKPWHENGWAREKTIQMQGHRNQQRNNKMAETQELDSLIDKWCQTSVMPRYLRVVYICHLSTDVTILFSE